MRITALMAPDPTIGNPIGPLDRSRVSTIV
jgi:hypothetical protein